LAANTEINDTLSGFMARFIYHFPRRPKERWLPLEEGEAINSDLELVVRKQLVAMSKTVSEMPIHQLRISEEASQYWTLWQKQRAKEIERRDDANEMQIHSRLVPLVAKLAMLFELGSSDFDPTRPIRFEYVVEACRLVDEYYHPMAMSVYDMVGRDLERNMIDRIIAFLKRHGDISTQREISRHVKIKMKELQEYLSTMAEDGTIEYCKIKNPTGPDTFKIILSAREEKCRNVGNVENVETVTRTTQEKVTTHEESNLVDTSDTVDDSDSSDSSTFQVDSPGEQDDARNQHFAEVAARIADGVPDNPAPQATGLLAGSDPESSQNDDIDCPPEDHRRTCHVCGRVFPYNLTPDIQDGVILYICTACHMGHAPAKARPPVNLDLTTALAKEEALVRFGVDRNASWIDSTGQRRIRQMQEGETLRVPPDQARTWAARGVVEILEGGA